jgi:hypothetical protein
MEDLHKALQLSMEQQFEQFKRASQVDDLTHAETKALLLDALRLIDLKDNVIKHLMDKAL